ncbi:MAG: type II toxin-antitoxin system prevent-host-death family antitoxin [Chitinivibrionia bacterium]|nr:type II toxin-antitoxin system prevent-host-death family antitoxin [Chitinivibrionia bacterium]
MSAIAYSDLKKNLGFYMDKVIDDSDPLVVTRKNGRNIVLVSADEYDSWTETAYLLSNKANAEHLLESIAQHKSGKIKETNTELYTR